LFDVGDTTASETVLAELGRSDERSMETGSRTTSADPRHWARTAGFEFLTRQELVTPCKPEDMSTFKKASTPAEWHSQGRVFEEQESFSLVRADNFTGLDERQYTG
jgi:hypothetical protein